MQRCEKVVTMRSISLKKLIRGPQEGSNRLTEGKKNADIGMGTTEHKHTVSHRTYNNNVSVAKSNGPFVKESVSFKMTHK